MLLLNSTPAVQSGTLQLSVHDLVTLLDAAVQY